MFINNKQIDHFVILFRIFEKEEQLHLRLFKIKRLNESRPTNLTIQHESRLKRPANIRGLGLLTHLLLDYLGIVGLVRACGTKGG